MDYTEADQRHAEIINEMVSLKVGGKGVTTPGVKMSKEETEKAESSKALEGEEATQYRARVARANYLGQDRGDIAFAVKELSRRMSRPTEADWEAFKRLGRYLVDKRRYVVKFGYQEEVRHLEAWSDTDWAGCLRTRRSTSGGVLMLGAHWIKGWSTTQAVLATSSREAEYYGMVRAASLGMGLVAVIGGFESGEESGQ